jgi:hypothetical protein
MLALVLVVALACSGTRGLSWEVDAGDAFFFSRVPRVVMRRWAGLVVADDVRRGGKVRSRAV